MLTFDLIEQVTLNVGEVCYVKIGNNLPDHSLNIDELRALWYNTHAKIDNVNYTIKGIEWWCLGRNLKNTDIIGLLVVEQ